VTGSLHYTAHQSNYNGTSPNYGRKLSGVCMPTKVAFAIQNQRYL